MYALNKETLKLLENLNTPFVSLKPTKEFLSDDIVTIINGDKFILLGGEIEGAIKNIFGDDILVEFDINDAKRCFIFQPYDLQLSRKSMSVYRVLKQEVEILNNGWDKKCDDLIRIITAVTGCYIFLRAFRNDSTICKVRQDARTVKEYRAAPCSDTCKRFSKLKLSLLWILTEYRNKNSTDALHTNIYGEKLNNQTIKEEEG